MSHKYDDIWDRGLPYGSIPYSEIVEKMEETLMDDEPKKNESYSPYEKYLRSEICDWTQDVPYLESDGTRRDAAVSNSILNLRYSGSRGVNDWPRHPEMFMGFMDADTRGLDNQPHMDQYNQQIITRMPQVEERMGKNSDYHIAEQPWTNMSLSTAYRDIQTSLKNNTKVFINERDGRPMNQNISMFYENKKPALIYNDPIYAGTSRENKVYKTNVKTGIPAVPLHSHEIDTIKDVFNSSDMTWKNNVPKKSMNNRHVDFDQDVYVEYNGIGTYKNKLKNASKTSMANNVDTDQNVYTEYNETGPYKSKLKNPTKTSMIDNMENDQANYDELLNSYQKNSLNISRPQQSKISITNNDQIFIPTVSPENVEKKKHPMNTSRSTMSTVVDDIYYPDPIQREPYHNHIGNIRNDAVHYDNTILANSVYIFQDNPTFKSADMNFNRSNANYDNTIETYQFKDFESGRTAIHNTNDNFGRNIGLSMHIDDTRQDLTQDRQNRTVFKEINNDNTLQDIDFSNQSNTLDKKGSTIKNEVKINNTQNQATFRFSDENTLGKTPVKNKITDITQSVYTVTPQPDIESIPSSKIMGSKSVRAGRYSEEDENISFQN